MKVLVNAVSIKEGGSLVVLERLLAEALRLDSDIEWAVCANPTVAPRLRSLERVDTLDCGFVDRWPGGLAYYYEVALPAMCRRLNVHVVFSQTNYLPVRSLPQPTLLLIQNAGHFSNEFGPLMEAVGGNLHKLAWRCKTRWVEHSARTASLVTVQTSALADEVVDRVALPRSRIRVIPHGPGIVDQRPRPRARRGGGMRIGYVTKYGVQKNFGVVLKAVAELKRIGLPARLVLTLQSGAGRHDTIDALEPTIDALGIGDMIENLGELPWSSMAAVYEGLDFFVFPSTCESFGFPLVEAMASALPVLVSDTPGNQEIAGPEAMAFPPHDHEMLAAGIRRLADDPVAYAEQSVRSLATARRYSWQTAALATTQALRELSRTETGRVA